MTKITALLIMTTLGMFAQESNTQQSIFGTTVEGYASHLYQGMPVAEAQAYLETRQKETQFGKEMKDLGELDQQIAFETDILRSMLKSDIVVVTTSDTAVQYLRVYMLEQRRLGQTQKMMNLLSGVGESYNRIRRLFAPTPEQLTAWDKSTQERFETWHAAMTELLYVVHEGDYDEVMLAAAKLLPARGRNQQVRLWEDHGKTPHYIKCGILRCNDPMPSYSGK